VEKISATDRDEVWKSRFKIFRVINFQLNYTDFVKKHFSIRAFRKHLKSDGHGGVLVRGTIGALAVKITGAAVLFGLHVLLARLLGVGEYGIYVYAIAWINILVLTVTLGFHTSLIRFISAYRAKQEWGLMRGLLRYSNLIVLISSIAAAIIGVIVISLLKNRISPEQRHTFYIAFLLLPIFAFVKLREAGLRALKNVVKSQLLLNIIRPLMLAIISLGLFFFIPANINASWIMVGNLAALIGVFIIGSIWLSKSLPINVRDKPSMYRQKAWLKVSLPLLFIVGMGLLLKRTDIIMLGAIRGSEDAGFYSAATHISNFLAFGLIAVNTILAPMIAELYHTRKYKELQRIILLAARGIFLFTALVGILLIVSGKYLLSFFGKDFVIAYIPLLVLLGGRIVCSLAGPVGFLLTMTDNQNQAGVIVASGATINIILNALLIPPMGAVGAAISTAFSMTVFDIVMFIYVLRKLNINPTILNIAYLLKKSFSD